MIVDDCDEVDWDETVDVICVGPGVAALAAAVAADGAGLDAMLTHSSGHGGADTLDARLGLSDHDTAAYLRSVTTDTGPLIGPADPVELTTRMVSVPSPSGPDGDGTFSGAALRDWAASCLASPYGLLRTAVAGPATVMLPVGTVSITETVELTDWLHERAREGDIAAPEQTSLRSLVFAAGQVVGALIDTPKGNRLVRAVEGLFVPTGTGARLPRLTTRGVGGTASAELVVSVRPFSRFARLELVASATTVAQDVARSQTGNGS